MNTWLCYMQLDGIKEQSRNIKSPEEGRSQPNTCMGQVPKGHGGDEQVGRGTLSTVQEFHPRKTAED